MGVDYELTGITKSYDGIRVLDGVDLRIETGEMIALTGPSGSGKSTLLNILGLLEHPDAGSLLLFGQSAPRPRSRAARQQLRHNLGYLFQNFALIDDASIRANLDVALTYAGGSEPAAQRREDALARVGLTGDQRRRVATLSGGEQQRLAIARLLLRPCRVILADEPTGSLDDGNRDRVLELLNELHHRGKTIIIATHDAQVVAACDRSLNLEGSPGPTPDGRR